jgi:hypothetical protein
VNSNLLLEANSLLAGSLAGSFSGSRVTGRFQRFRGGERGKAPLGFDHGSPLRENWTALIPFGIPKLVRFARSAPNCVEVFLYLDGRGEDFAVALGPAKNVGAVRYILRYI